jgi:AcrR family transcriptional regulator
MSLYNHVANKDDILRSILEMVYSEITLPSDESRWKSEIRASAISAYDALRRHRWASSLMMSPHSSTSLRLRWMDAVLRCLRNAGFSAELTCHAYHAIDSHITGFTLWQLSIPFTKEELPIFGAAFLRQLPVDEFPYVAEHIEHHITGLSADGEGEFRFGLDLILDGLERMRDMT